MEELFKMQIEKAEPLTAEVLSSLNEKQYFNGDYKQIGDIILYALIQSESDDNTFQLQTLTTRHIDLFVPCYENSKAIQTMPSIPPIKLI